jgi:hypothetical protein
MTFDFQKLTTWRLLKGSHEFPGSAGGTCVTEAALVAAGFKYQKIDKPEDCPVCFSRPIVRYAIRLNDNMPDKLRQELLIPFVTRLAGTADQSIVEMGRQNFIVRQQVRGLLALVCREVFKRRYLSQACSRVTTTMAAMDTARSVIGWANGNGYKRLGREDIFQFHLYVSEYNKVLQRTYFTMATQILEEAILLGKHEPAGDIEMVNTRLEIAKQAAHRKPIVMTAEPLSDVVIL